MRARTKRLEDIDPELVCCEQLAQRFRAMAEMEIEVTEPIFSGCARCTYCHRMHPRMRYATMVGNPFDRDLRSYNSYTCIALPFVDLDEGTEEKFTQFKEFVDDGTWKRE